MKHIILLLVLGLYSLSLYTSCASQQPVTGGPKDTIPPTLISTLPAHKSLNFQGKTISLTFDEYIKEDQIQTKLIITPDDQNKFKTLIKKNTITLEFETPFKDSTTYTINFNSSIEDITENNEAENIILAFSTTTYIDSLFISGQITQLFTSQPVEAATVALYQAKDTTDIFNKRPLYFSKTDKDGNFRLENLKQGNYRLYAFSDKNNNNLCEADAEPHGFFADTIRLTSNLDSLRIPIVRNDVRPLNQLASRVSGAYFESRYNKPLKGFKATIIDSTASDNWQLLAALTEDSRGILFYPSGNPKRDSILISIHAFDSTANFADSEDYLRFEASKRSLQKFTSFTYPEKNTEVLPKTSFSVRFNKPIITSHLSDSLFVSIDTLYKKHLQPDTVIWNDNKTAVSISVTLDPLLVTKQQTRYQQLLDSVQSDTTSTTYKQTLLTKELWTKVPTNYTGVKLPKGTFISADGDSSQLHSIPLKFVNPEERGIIRGSITTTHQRFFIELIDNKYKTVATQPGSQTFEFKNVKPGDYSIRVLIDANHDGAWSTGNSLRWIAPEPVYVFPEFFNVRANWTMENITLKF